MSNQQLSLRPRRLTTSLCFLFFLFYFIFPSNRFGCAEATTNGLRRPENERKTETAAVPNGIHAVGPVEEEPTVVLHNGIVFPLRGLGVGNLQHELIPSIVQEGIRLGVRLIDTAHASQNEAFIANAIRLHVAKDESSTSTSTMPSTSTSNRYNNSNSNSSSIHVVTKVWYTHLGYERTKYSVQESLQAFSMPNSSGDHVNVHANNNNTKFQVHMLIHWPRCSKDIPWMDCANEETNLPEHVQVLGPPPHLDSFAYLESWRALEGFYQQGDLASIGISNFEVLDLQKLLEHATVKPHIIQINVWSLLFDPELIQLCHNNNIHIQVYNVMNGIFSRQSQSPNAVERLSELAELYNNLSSVQLVVSWLVQQGISVIPRTTRLDHLHDNAAATTPTATSFITLEHQEEIRRIVAVMLQGRDLDLPKATFVSQHDAPVNVYWKHEESGEELFVKKDLQPGESFHSNTYPGHIFVVYESSSSSSSSDEPSQTKPQRRREFQISAGFGDEEEIHIEL